ncbi:MAG: rhodanese-like domain-containing protein [Vicingaceae bacterium]
MFEMFRNAMGFGNDIDYKALKEEGAVVLDVRSPMEFNGGHYREAMNIPLDQLEQKVNQLTDKNKPILTCCVSGARSGTAKRILESKGFTRVYNGGNWNNLGQKLQ